MKESEKRAREKLRQRDIHVTKKGGAHIEEHAMTHKEGKLRSISDTIKTLRGK